METDTSPLSFPVKTLNVGVGSICHYNPTHAVDSDAARQAHTARVTVYVESHECEHDDAVVTRVTGSDVAAVAARRNA